MTDKTPAGLALLRKPFPDNQISYLPKGGAQLAYVGHAALTDRLLDADPNWSWEPLALDSEGLPTIDECGGLWIKLTVCGVTRLGYGDAQGKTGVALRAQSETHRLADRSQLRSMMHYAESTTCRWTQVLAYFGERLARPCERCDRCA